MIVGFIAFPRPIDAGAASEKTDPYSSINISRIHSCVHCFTHVYQTSGEYSLLIEFLTRLSHLGVGRPLFVSPACQEKARRPPLPVHQASALNNHYCVIQGSAGGKKKKKKRGGQNNLSVVYGEKTEMSAPEEKELLN